ncbi:hypothetical protein QBC41DRAFT_304959 [Cercophora samala]|uniref:Uncharacterized protein n=1 Tax=Cercophora samala TaxID=330535 RepID=A0AA40DAT0_9PEZI|nr:hypothetical protein QBC41DRAFT_304959 [Cercophora samala]
MPPQTEPPFKALWGNIRIKALLLAARPVAAHFVGDIHFEALRARDQLPKVVLSDSPARMEIVVASDEITIFFVVLFTGGFLVILGLLCWYAVVAYRRQQEATYADCHLPMYNPRPSTADEDQTTAGNDMELPNGASSHNVRPPPRALLHVRAGSWNLAVAFGTHPDAPGDTGPDDNNRPEERISSSNDNATRITPPPPYERY